MTFPTIFQNSVKESGLVWSGGTLFIQVILWNRREAIVGWRAALLPWEQLEAGGGL